LGYQAVQFDYFCDGLNKKAIMITTGNTIVSIYTEMTPNPETMKFVANKLLYPGKSLDVAEEGLATASPLAKELFSFPFIKSVFIASNFVTLTKTTDTEDWQDVIPTIKTFLKEYLEAGGVVVNEDEVAKMKQEATNVVSADGARVLASASTAEAEVRTALGAAGKGGNAAAATVIGKRIAEKAKAAGVEKVAFDRAGFAYHGRVKALAEAAREAGLQF
jgi:ribosomal protein L18